MTNSGGQNWTTSIPHQSAGKSVYYYIKARTSNGKYFSKPITAPQGNWRFNITSPTAIGINGNNIPKEFKLYQNFPNPFNPSTFISFDIPKESYITLKVYDLQGREVKIIIDGLQKAGSFKAEFNASELASGIYFYKLSSDNISFTRKMILVK
jgi:hypothetical protein